MNTQIIRSIKILTLAVIVCGGIGLVYGQWTSPPTPPPSNNTPEPLNVGPTVQSKAGGLDVDSYVTVDNAVFSQDIDPIDGAVFGDTVTSKGLEMTGDAITQAVHLKSIDINGILTSNDNIKVKGKFLTVGMVVDDLRHSNAGTIQKDLVCADENFMLVLCNP